MRDSASDSVDILITGGTIVDGTGAPARPRTVVVEGDRMRVLPPGADHPSHATTTIDAAERIVAPGFIDLHSHGGLVILAEPRHEPKVRQGVTTEIVGVDGNGFAPFRRREDLEAFVHLDSGLDGRPAASSVVSRRRKIFGTCALSTRWSAKSCRRTRSSASKWTMPRTTHTVDRRVVVNPVQARSLLDAVAGF